MHTRCTNRNRQSWRRYGGRGISVCERWQTFEHFYADMGSRPSPKHKIERKDNDGNYEPKNCRWATDEEQANNTSANVRVIAAGEVKTLSQWAKESPVSAKTISNRIRRGASGENAIANGNYYTGLVLLNQERFAEAMKRVATTQCAVAQAIGSSKSAFNAFVKRIERGGLVRRLHVERFAAVASVPAEWLIARVAGLVSTST